MQEADFVTPGSRIGTYEVRRIIATGGMGTIYEAVQEKPRRVVALKMMRRGLSSTSALRRFQYESDFLARLRHPCVAQIYEAGSYVPDEGGGGQEIPYFAMEYIEEARDILQYAAEEKLSRLARLDLFLKVCDGVHHGHQRGVIHRDLKPANLLIDGSGRCKIIDFGVARAVDAERSRTSMLTEAGQVVGTLQYMSPEQLERDPEEIDIRSDVYGLGVLLYVLLSGELPYDVNRLPIHKALDVICRELPRMPSVADSTLSGDLEWIIVRAMNKDRDERYASVSALSADILRHKTDQPVVAGPPSTGYRMKKFISRHRLGVAAALVVFLALLAGMAGILFGLVEARAQQMLAEAEARKAQTVADLLTDMFSAAVPWEEGREVKVVDLLDRAAWGLSNPAGGEPEVNAYLRAVIGMVYFGLGMSRTALSHLEPASEVLVDLVGEGHPHTIQARCNLARVLRDLNRLEAGQRLAETNRVESLRALGAEHPLSLRTLACLADAFACEDRFKESLALNLELHEQHVRLHGEVHVLSATSKTRVAQNLAALDRLDEAERLYQEALKMQQDLLGPGHYHTVSTQKALARVFHQQGREAEAEPILRSVYETQCQSLGQEHPSTIDTLNLLAELEASLGRLEAAEANHRSAFESFCNRYGEKSVSALSQLSDLVVLLIRQGRYEDAEPLSRDALEGLSLQLGPHHLKTVQAKRSVYTLRYYQAQYVESECLVRENLEACRKLFGEDHTETLLELNMLGGLLSEQGRLDEAEPLFRKTVKGYTKILGYDHPETINLRSNLAGLLVRRGEYQEAETLSREVLDDAERVMAKDHEMPDFYRMVHGVCLKHLERFDEAELELRLSHEALEAKLGREHVLTRTAAEKLEDLYSTWGK